MVKVPLFVLAPKVAVVVTSVWPTTWFADAINEAFFVPAATTTEAGIIKDELLLDVNVTTMPDGAGLERPIVPMAIPPETTEPVLKNSPVKVGAVTDNLLERETPEALAVRVLETSDKVGEVEMVTVAEFALVGIVTLAGIWTAEFVDDRLRVIPPVGAGPESVIVSVVEVPPGTELALSIIVLGTATARLMGVENELEPSDAVIVADEGLVIALVVIVKVAVFWLAATVTLAGTTTAAPELTRLTEIPPVGAMLLRVTVPTL